MKNIINYVEKYGNLRFDQLLFNEVDSLILSQFSYNDLKILKDQGFSTFKIRDIKDQVTVLSEVTWLPKQDAKLLKLLATSKRFGDLEIKDFYEVEKPLEGGQFTAFVCRIYLDTILVVNRGTDASFTGWAESLALSFEAEIPAQRSAKAYLEMVAKKYPQDKLILAGHSKGGNLVAFAASTVDKGIQDRIEIVYDLDGPGFLPEFFQRDDYKGIEDKIKLVLPERSVVGMLLVGIGRPKVIDSKGLFLEQHSPFYWAIEDALFKEKGQVDSISKFTNNTINKWMQSVDRTERKEILKHIFNFFDGTGASDFKDILSPKFETYRKLRTGLESLNEVEINTLKDGFSEFIKVLKEEAMISFKSLNDK